MPSSVELFAGGGGLALGLQMSGFRHHALVENDSRACATLRLNGRTHAIWSPDAVIDEDVRQSQNSIVNRVSGDVDLLAGGPPCQPFSLGGIHAGHADMRNMFPAALDTVRLLQPKIVLFENVPGLLRSSFAPYFDYVTDQLAEPTVIPRVGESWDEHWTRVRKPCRANRSLRYRVARQLILAADLGVSQMRRRVFLVGIRDDVVADCVPLEMDHGEDALLQAKFGDGSYWQEHADDPEVKRFLRSGQPSPTHAQARRLVHLAHQEAAAQKRWRTVRDALVDPEPLPNPVDGRQRGNWSGHIGIPGARSYPGHTGSDIDLPSKTIKAGVHGVCGGEAVIRFIDGSLRYMTVRESARIQGFPDWYDFEGPRSTAMRHIGNAVAVPVARAVGEHLRTITGI